MTAANEFVISRVVNAPAALVFKAWTDLESLRKWWGPKGFEMHSCTLDLRPGGVFHYGMTAPGGGEMWGKMTFREIVPPEKLVFVVSFSDKEGNSLRSPMAPGWPLEILSTVTFEEHHGKTTIAMRGVPVNATDEETATFVKGFDSMRMGWGGSFAQLDAFLAGSGAA
jgi:uncharacterized protein YndB with AHSA1/START domain